MGHIFVIERVERHTLGANSKAFFVFWLTVDVHHEGDAVGALFKYLEHEMRRQVHPLYNDALVLL